MNDIEQTAFNYGRYSEKRRRVGASHIQYIEYNQLCLALLRELKDCGALDKYAMLKSDYAEHFNSGRDSVSEY